MNADEHLEAFFATWSKRDPERMGRFYAHDAVMADPTLERPRRGRSEIVEYYARMFATLEEPYHDLLDWAAREDRVWFEWRFGSGGASSPREDYHGVSIQTFRDGLVAHDEAFWVPGA